MTDRTVSPDRQDEQDRQGRTAPLHWQGRMHTLRKEYSSTNSAPAPAGQEGRTGQARQEWQTGQDREGGLDERGRTVFPGRQGGSDMPDRQGIQSRQVRLDRLDTQSSPVEAFFFDLDGTLADTLPQLAKAAQDTMRCLKLRVPETDEVRSYIGNGIDNLIARCLLQDAKASASDADTAVLRRCRQVYNEVYAKGLSQNFTVYQGVEAALKRLKAKGLALAVVTNKPQVFAGPLIGFMGLAGYFDLILGSESGTARKPSPEPLLYAAKKFSTVPGRTVMVGDSDNDILAAHNAGAHSVFMTYGYYRGEPETLKPDYCLDSMLTLPDLAW